jgi:hypothetical protein
MQIIYAEKLYIFVVLFSVFQDFIGRACPTTDCVTQANERSVITKIEIVGDDATIRTSIETPKVETPVKESKKAK